MVEGQSYPSLTARDEASSLLFCERQLDLLLNTSIPILVSRRRYLSGLVMGSTKLSCDVGEQHVADYMHIWQCARDDSTTT